MTQRLRTGASIAILTLPGGVAQVTAGPFPADDAYKTDWVYRELTEEMAANRRSEDAVAQLALGFGRALRQFLQRPIAVRLELQRLADEARRSFHRSTPYDHLELA